jgi:hypothetical protein
MSRPSPTVAPILRSFSNFLRAATASGVSHTVARHPALAELGQQAARAVPTMRAESQRFMVNFRSWFVRRSGQINHSTFDESAPRFAPPPDQAQPHRLLAQRAVPTISM